MGVRTVMVTGDSATTAAAIAHEVGIEGDVCSAEALSDQSSVERYGIFARVVPEVKFNLVQALQRIGHIVGMCGDGVNDRRRCGRRRSGLPSPRPATLPRRRQRWC